MHKFVKPKIILSLCSHLHLEFTSDILIMNLSEATHIHYGRPINLFKVGSLKTIYFMSRRQEKNLGVSSWRLKRIARMYESGISINEISRQINLSLSEVRKILHALGYR